MVWCMATRNKKLYTAGSDNVIKVWDLDNLQRGCIKTIQGHTNAVSIQSTEGLYQNYTGTYKCCKYHDLYFMPLDKRIKVIVYCS